MLRIDIQSDSCTATLKCSGRVVFGMELETLRSVALSRKERVLHIDLARVETVDASGLGLLVELQHWATVSGRSLQFTDASDFVARLVVLTPAAMRAHVPGCFRRRGLQRSGSGTQRLKGKIAKGSRSSSGAICDHHRQITAQRGSAGETYL